MSNVIRAAVLAATLVAVPASAANLLINGDFENTGFGGTGGYYNLGPSGSGADNPVPSDFGWDVPVNNVDIIANGVYAAPLATGGSYNLDLVGYGSTGAISQTFDTIAGKTYKLRLDYTQNGGGKTADVLVDNATLGTLNATGAWQKWSTTFVGTGSLTTLTIAEVVGGGNAGVVLDNIAVAGVPEPASWALMLGGFGLVGLAMRKRQVSVVAA